MLIFALLVLLSGLVGYALLRQQRIQRIQSALQRIPKAQQGRSTRHHGNDLYGVPMAFWAD